MSGPNASLCLPLEDRPPVDQPIADPPAAPEPCRGEVPPDASVVSASNSRPAVFIQPLWDGITELRQHALSFENSLLHFEQDRGLTAQYTSENMLRAARELLAAANSLRIDVRKTMVKARGG